MFYCSNSSCVPVTRRQILALLSFPVQIGWLVGCASPGIPRPPSLNLSRVATGLSAQRVGDAVILTWTTPDRTTDNLDLKGSLTVRVCRKPLLATTSSNNAAAVPQAATCLEAARLPVKTGASTATDTLPAAFATGPATLLEYAVEILNPSGRSAGLSAPAYAAAGANPPAVEGLHASPIPTGIMLEWDALPASSTFVDLTRVDTTLQAQQSQAKSDSKTSGSKAPIQLAGKPSAEVHLHAQATLGNSGVQPDGSGAPMPEAPGTLDNSARFGDTYIYTARRIRAVQLGGHSLTLESVSSAPVTLILRDVFPPAVPTGLAAIPNRQPPSIDLSWQPNTEPDLAGYLVYRRAVFDSGAATRLTPAPVQATDFRDAAAAPGQRYSYSITAVDASGNESKPSLPVEEILGQF